MLLKIDQINLSFIKYFEIIDKARTLDRKKLNYNDPNYKYLEEHHIIPKSLGGYNTISNLVLLTPEEHYLCHSFIVDFCEGESKAKMLFAWDAMNGRDGVRNEFLLGPKKYAELKVEAALSKRKKLSIGVIHLNENFEFIERYESATEAALKLNYPSSANVSAVAAGCIPHYKEQHWVYSTLYDINPKEAIRKIIIFSEAHGKPIQQFDSNNVFLSDFKSAKQAGKILKIRASEIINSLLGLGDETEQTNFRWRFDKRTQNNPGWQGHKNGTTRGVTEFDENWVMQKHYPSAKVAAKELLYPNAANITACLTGRSPHHKEQHWIYTKEYFENPKLAIKKAKLISETHGKPIQQLDHSGGVIGDFCSALVASLNLKISLVEIINSIINKIKTADGFNFKLKQKGET